ncbi:class I SAM-dependent methyltransferase [Candidatus Raskinella chloraquaticus]|jgi:SAM-dependent methyltransferase|uniref:Methyltransferase domain-containing protein n=1 Tax=Candidatus Raskinella chloraquaticus TaxID=1951219 RepID=A0A1W9HQ88_9HYPH|nr:MAG: hypothetical protein A4S15_01360 [Proteobacteria bacterium SG_bin8]
MSEIRTGLRRFLEDPRLYELVQKAMGARHNRQAFVDRYIRPRPGDRVLDVGCGPAALLSHLPGVNYTGFDPNPAYIQQAQRRYGEQGQFHAKIYDEADVCRFKPFDIAIISAVLHHLDDQEARRLFGLLRRSLKPGGRVLTLDNVYVDDQNLIARLLISLDRGQNVRSPEGYRELATGIFDDVHGDVVHKAIPPYTYYIMSIR